MPGPAEGVAAWRPGPLATLAGPRALRPRYPSRAAGTLPPHWHAAAVETPQATLETLRLHLANEQVYDSVDALARASGLSCPRVSAGKGAARYRHHGLLHLCAVGPQSPDLRHQTPLRSGLATPDITRSVVMPVVLQGASLVLICVMNRAMTRGLHPAALDLGPTGRAPARPPPASRARAGCSIGPW